MKNDYYLSQQSAEYIRELAFTIVKSVDDIQDSGTTLQNSILVLEEYLGVYYDAINDLIDSQILTLQIYQSDIIELANRLIVLSNDIIEICNFNMERTPLFGETEEMGKMKSLFALGEGAESNQDNNLINNMIDMLRSDLVLLGVTNDMWLNEKLQKVHSAIEQKLGGESYSEHNQDSLQQIIADCRSGIYNSYMKQKKCGAWNIIQDTHSIQSDLKWSNPNFSLGVEWQENCQRCVPTFEMRRRGYDVTAYPAPKGIDHLSYNPFDVWCNPKVILCQGDGMGDIEKYMQQWGDGARAQIVVYWDNTNSGHTFIAEQRNGKTIFCDPQTGEEDVSSYFSMVELNKTQLCRIDTLLPNNRINDCCTNHV